MKATKSATVVESSNEVMDSRIVKLNELKSVKMANLSKGKRPAAKEAKELATYILANWDNEFELLKIKSEDVKNDDLQSILSSRLQNFKDAKGACDKAVVIEANEAPVTHLSENTIGYIQREWGNKKGQELPAKEMKNIIDALEKEGISNIMKINAFLKNFGLVRKDKNPSQVKNEAPIKKAPESKKTEEVKKETVKPVTSTKKVGDVHPNGKWAWTEYAAGKFDWRTIPSLKEKTGAKPKTDNPEVKKSEKTVQAKKNVAKQPKAKEAKKNEPEEKKEFTTSDFIAMPKMRRGDKLSKAQEEALKLILKGYWIWNNGGTHFFKNETGETKSCNMESVIAMFKKYGIVELPVDLIR